MTIIRQCWAHLGMRWVEGVGHVSIVCRLEPGHDGPHSPERMPA